jgi:hypothetical protein
MDNRGPLPKSSNFSLFIALIPVLGPTYLPIQWIPGALSQGSKQRESVCPGGGGGGSGHSPQPGAEIQTMPSERTGRTCVKIKKNWLMPIGESEYGADL